MNTTEEDSIIINMHGSPNSVSNINLDDINSKNADYVYLLSCSAGDQYTSNNFAVTALILEEYNNEKLQVFLH